MKVLHISLSTYPGSNDKNAGIFVRKLINLQNEKGINAYLLTGSAYFFPFVKKNFEYFSEKYIITNYQRGISKIPTLRKLLHKKLANKFLKEISIIPDIIHCHFASNSLIGQQFSKALNCPYLVTLHENHWTFEKMIVNESESVKKAIISSHLLTRPNSIDIIDLYKWCISSEKISYLPNYVDENSFKITTRKNREVIKKEMKINDKKIITNIASLQRKKGQDLLIHSASILKEEVPNIEVWIIGEGPEKKRLKEIAVSIGIGDNVKFIGRIDNSKLQDYLSCTDVFAFPSVSESFGIGQVEAMLTGLPVVATHNYGSEDIIIENVNGYLCNSRNPKDYANLLKKALENSWDKEKIRETAVERYGSDAIFNKLKSIYLNVIETYKKQRGVK